MSSPFKACQPTSRIESDVTRLFDFYCELNRKTRCTRISSNSSSATVSEGVIVDSYPADFKDENTLRQLPQYAYPCDVINRTTRWYSFVMTTEDAKWRYGYCRHETESDSVLMVLSYLPWHETFKKLLSVIAYLRYKNSPELITFISNCYKSNVPPAGEQVKIQLDSQKCFVFSHPAKNRLPSIPENVCFFQFFKTYFHHTIACRFHVSQSNLTIYQTVTPPDIMIAIFASMILERRIIFTSRHLDRHSACVQAANALLYPLQWQHAYLPVLPVKLRDYLSSPSPYLIGVPTCVLELICESSYGDAVVYNCDSQTFESVYDDLKAMPAQILLKLRKRLSTVPSKNSGEAISRIFLNVMVKLLGRYRDGVEFRDRGPFFNLSIFLRSHPRPIRPFLYEFIDTAMCFTFIFNRMEMLRIGTIAWDEFELESVFHAQKHSKHNYKCFRRKKRVFPKGHFMTPARTSLQENALNAVDVAENITQKLKKIVKSRKFDRPRREMDLRELLTNLSYWLVVGSEAFRDLHQKCIVDMKQLGYIEQKPKLCDNATPQMSSSKTPVQSTNVTNTLYHTCSGNSIVASQKSYKSY